MHVNDRGSKKWTSIMLPEHVEALRKLFAEYDHEEKPVLDEQQLAENERVLQEAIEYDLTIEVKYFKDYGIHTIKGRVMFIQAQNSYVQLDNVRIDLDDIIEVML